MPEHSGVFEQDLRQIDLVLDTVPTLSQGKPRVQALTGGITNRNYVLDAETGSYVVRLGGENADLLGIDREREYACSLTAARLGISPEVIASVLEQDALVTRFVSGRALSSEEAREAAMLGRVVEVLRRFHEWPAVPGKFSPFDTVRRYHALACDRGVVFPDVQDRALDLVASMEETLQTGEPACPCHNDLLPANLIADGARIWIIDWEYAAMGDRFFDLGNLAVNLGLDETGERLLLQLYFGEVRVEDLHRLRLMRLVSDMRESMWGYLQSAISTLYFDFLEYGRAHLDRFLGAADQLVAKPPG